MSHPSEPLHFKGIFPLFKKSNRFPVPLLLLSAMAGILLPLIGYCLLPGLGVTFFAESLGLPRVILLCAGLTGIAFYWRYLQWALPRPQIIVGFILLAWPPVAYFNAELLNVGLNLHLRPLLLLALAVPMVRIAWRNRELLLERVPWLKYYLVFFLWLTLYAVFYNANAVDPRLSGGEEAMSEGSVSMVQLTAYFYCLAGMAACAVAFLKTRNPKGLFDALNRGILWVSGLEALVTVAGYPLGMFTTMLDGFLRSYGIFPHPNPFAHHMGILTLYLVGLCCYYQGERKARMPGWLLLGGLAINLAAFLLGLSKTALGVFVLCAGILLTLNLATPAVRRNLPRVLLGLAVLAPLTLLGFEVLSGQSFFSLLESRLDQTQSLTWRTDIWGDLLADINLGAIWLGHGFTAANNTVFHLTFNDARNAQPLMMVHNAYIALLYDLGIFGYAMFAAVVSMLLHAFRYWLSSANPGLKTEHSIILALAVYFLCVCAFDEMSYMFDAPMLFWMLATILHCMRLREGERKRTPEPASGALA